MQFILNISKFVIFGISFLKRHIGFHFSIFSLVLLNFTVLGLSIRYQQNGNILRFVLLGITLVNKNLSNNP